MGKASREKPKRLAEKLLQIRIVLELSQSEMVKHLGVTGVCVDVLIDDKLNLPDKLPSRLKHGRVFGPMRNQ